jgi:hypothetical protein
MFLKLLRGEKKMEKREDVYIQNGYKDRTEYLNNIADNYGIDSFTVNMIADMLGPSEDFDGLISELDDYEMLSTLGGWHD